MKGVLVGADARQEWLLSWWWENFRKQNHCPVAFADFGLSREMKAWCKERGELIELLAPPLFVKDRDEVGDSLAEQWESRYPDGVWDSRKAWFKKPLACLQSPYEWTVWADVDCEIVGPLDGIWEHRLHGFAVAKDLISKREAFPIYNSGVIVFQKRHPLLIDWAREALEKNGCFRGDQDLLSQIISEKSYFFSELPASYNWCVGQGKKEDAVIYHWSGDAAKSLLRKKLILEANKFV